MFYFIFFGLLVIFIAFMALDKFIFHKIDWNSNKFKKVAKIILIVWMSFYFLNLFLPDGLCLRNYDHPEKFADGKAIPFVLLRWANDISFIALPVAIYKDKKSFNRITSYFLTTIVILNAIFFYKYMEFYTNGDGAGIMALRFLSQSQKEFFVNEVFRGIYLGIILFLEALLSFYVLFRSFGTNKFVDKKDVLNTFLVLIGLAISIVPIYAPQYLLKGYSVPFDAFGAFKLGSFFHIVWIISIAIIGIVLSLIFKNKEYEDKYILVLIMALSLLLQYNEMFTCVGEITAHRMPFQLCNMAGFIILLTLLTKNEHIYHFTLVINAVGALIAIAMCDTTPYGVAYVMNYHYMVEHTNVALVPILCAVLGVFKPLKLKDIKDFIIGFTVYFLFVLIVGGVFTGLKETTGSDFWNCNYLFMFNKAESVKILGFVGPLFDVNFKLFNFFTLSLVQLVVYVIFLAICCGAFFGILAIFKEKKTKVING